MDDWKTQEFGVTCSYPTSFAKKLGNQWSVTKKLRLSRAFSALSLSQIVEEFEGVGMTAISCVDAIPSLGISGLIWKKILGEKVDVTVNATDAESRQTLEKNIQENNFSSDNISVVHQDPNALLHSGKKYNFVYLEAYGTVVRYLEAACRALCHRGVICLVSTDLSTLYNKCPQRVPRLYYGHIMKHEYHKELALRLIIANVIRAASRWDKGINVLASYVDEDAITIVVRVLKGATHADSGLSGIQKVAHCRICSHRSLIPEKLYHTSKPNIEMCLCEENNHENGAASAPIVMLGPVATGAIFDTKYLLGMIETLCRLDKSSKHITILKNMVVESMCFGSEQEEIEFIKAMNDALEVNTATSNESSEPPPKKIKESNKMDALLSKFPMKEFPIFYYVGQVHTKRGFNPPKNQMIIEQLRSEGFRACKTLFDPRGVRTSANTKQFVKIIEKISKETAKS